MKIILSFLLLLLVSPINAEGPQGNIPKQVQAFIDTLETEKKDVQGIAIAILYKGQVIYKTTSGYQAGNTNPITSKTLFPLASVSKFVSAAAVSLLVNDGTLNLDEDYSLPCFSSKVNLKNILGHTTGYQFSGNPQIESGINRSNLLAKLKSQKPSSKPGQGYFYSNTTFSLIEEALNTKKLTLSAAIEKLQTLLKTEEIQIFPLKKGFQVAYPHIRNRDNSELETLPFPPHYPKVVPASAGVFASLDGMIELFKLQFGYRPDLISQKTLDQFHFPYSSNTNIEVWGKNWPCPLPEIESFYGLGCRILKAKKHKNKDLIFHSGMISGITSFIGFIPSEEMGIIILVNQSSHFPLQKGIDFWGLFLT